MTENNPVIVLEDDLDDQEIMEAAFQNLKLGNKRFYFETGEELYQFLLEMQEQPLVIISDVNLPKINGIELKAKIEANPVLKGKTIPFVFFSTATNPLAVNKAYNEDVQGFFQKPVLIGDVEKILACIIFYWTHSKHPNNL